MQIVEGSQNPTQWSHPSHPGSLWSLAILCGPCGVFQVPCAPLRSLVVFIVTPQCPYLNNTTKYDVLVMIMIILTYRDHHTTTRRHLLLPRISLHYYRNRHPSLFSKFAC